MMRSEKEKDLARIIKLLEKDLADLDQATQNEREALIRSRHLIHTVICGMKCHPVCILGRRAIYKRDKS